MTSLINEKGASRAASAPLPQETGPSPSRAMKMTGMDSKTMEALLGAGVDPKTANLPPIAPTTNVVVQVGNRQISSAKPSRKWIWSSFSSSARNDGAKFNHWVRAGVSYPEYPFARFDIHLDHPSYTDEQYAIYFGNSSTKASAFKTAYGEPDNTWTKSETDKLMELCKLCELRWPVIYDRWQDEFEGDKRKIEDLQYRYYYVAAVINQALIAKEARKEVDLLASSAASSAATGDSQTVGNNLLETAATRSITQSERIQQPLLRNTGEGTANKLTFNLSEERKRRKHVDMIWNRTKEEELEEAELRKELALVEAQLRKWKKKGGHLPAHAAASSSSRAPSPIVVSKLVSDSSTSVDKAFHSVPTPQPGTPYLQSARLIVPGQTKSNQGQGINKALLKKADALLTDDFGVPLRPIATKRVCDLFDSVRKESLLLLSLQKIALQYEASLQTKRLRLSKLGGSIRIADEQTLLGISPAPPPQLIPKVIPTSAAPRAAGRNARGSGGGGSGGGGKGKRSSVSGAQRTGRGTSTKQPAGSEGKQTKKSAGTKRKKKAASSEGRKSASLVTAATAGATGTSVTTAPAAVGETPRTSTAAGDGKSTNAKKRARKSVAQIPTQQTTQPPN